MSRDLTSLLDVLLAARRAIGFAEGLDAASFHADERTRWAIYGQVIIIGEASGRVSREFQQDHPEIPWSNIIGMRHRLVHGYDDIDWPLVWDTVVSDLPSLVDTIDPLVPKEH